MLIPAIDTHIHIWDLKKSNYTWLQKAPVMLKRNFDIQELEQSIEAAEIKEGILVQSDNGPMDTDYMISEASKVTWITGVVGWLPLQQPEKLDDIWNTKYKEYSIFKGVRHLIHNEENDRWLLQPNVLQSLAWLAEKNLAYDVVGTTTVHLESAIQVADKIGRLTIVLDHLNQPPSYRSADWQQWCDLVKEAALRPNIKVKISGLGNGATADGRWNADDIQPAVEFVLQQFTAERVCCGGDWPVSLQASGYAYTWQQYRNVLKKLLNPALQEKVLYSNAKTFYKL